MECSPRGEPDKSSYGKVISSGVRCSIFAIGVLTLTLVVLSGVVFSISIKAREKSQVVVYKTVAQSNDSRYQGHTRREEAKEEVNHSIRGGLTNFFGLSIARLNRFINSRKFYSLGRDIKKAANL